MGVGSVFVGIRVAQYECCTRTGERNSRLGTARVFSCLPNKGIRRPVWVDAAVPVVQIVLYFLRSKGLPFFFSFLPVRVSFPLQARVICGEVSE